MPMSKEDLRLPLALSRRVSRICFLTWKGKRGTLPANSGTPNLFSFVGLVRVHE